ncbi:MAG: MBL fold metallo-hydrolase, partial [Desulfobacteraceae bacterium]|nr:MBL fold metallo-hydrolase [Desulfobacteraceae bacterium]
MRVCKEYDFNKIKGFKLGWSLLGPPLMTTYCFAFGDMMIDTGQSHMQKQVLKIAEDHQIKRVVLTHHHEDHSGNAAAIKQKYGSSIYGHELTKKKMSTLFHILPYQKYVWGKATPLKIDLIPESIDTDLGKMIPVHTPGHSKDHMAYYLKNEGVLFSGDLYLADEIKFFRSDEDLRTQIASLKKILKLDFDILLCSHYPKLKNGKNRIKNK